MLVPTNETGDSIMRKWASAEGEHYLAASADGGHDPSLGATVGIVGQSDHVIAIARTFVRLRQ